MLSLPPPLSLLQLFPPIPTEWGLEQGMTLIISLAIWLQGGESVECVFSVARELQDESGLCVCVSLTQALSSCPPSSRRTCSAWAGLTLTSEKSDNRSDVTSSWAHTYGHTRRSMRCYQRTRVKETAFPTIQRHSLHGSAAQSGAAVNTVPAWCGGAPRNRQTPSLFHPADLGV